MRPRHLFTAAVVALVVLVVVSGYNAFTASSTVAASKVGLKKSTFSVNDLKPDECTMTVTSLKVAGNATATFQLVLGTSGADTVTLRQSDCFVGGNGRDRVTGASGAQCVINSSATETNCAVVARRPF